MLRSCAFCQNNRAVNHIYPYSNNNKRRRLIAQTRLTFYVFNVWMSMRHIYRNMPIFSSCNYIQVRLLLLLEHQLGRQKQERQRERDREKINPNPLQVRKNENERQEKKYESKETEREREQLISLLLPHISSSVLYWQLSICFRSYNPPVHILFLMPSTLYKQREKRKEVIVHIHRYIRKYSPSGHHHQQLVSLLVRSFAHLLTNSDHYRQAVYFLVWYVKRYHTSLSRK